VLAAVRANHNFTQAYLAREFQKNNNTAVCGKFAKGLQGVPTAFEPHVEFKKRVPGAIGLIRTGDTVQYANMILISG
jgi:D-ribose pyranase